MLLLIRGPQCENQCSGRPAVSPSAEGASCWSLHVTQRQNWIHIQNVSQVKGHQNFIATTHSPLLLRAACSLSGYELTPIPSSDDADVLAVRAWSVSLELLDRQWAPIHGVLISSVLSQLSVC